MALPASGAISLSDFNTELGITAGTAISMSDADVRALLDLASGAEASFSGYYGASSVADIALTIAANTNNYNIFSNKGGTYSAGKSNITLTINSGVTVGSTSTGTYALDTGTGWASGDTITIVNNGTVKGRGGDGGAGANVKIFSASPDVFPNGNAGNTGGNAFRAQFATTFTNNGSVYGGGGGGGGSGSFSWAIGKSGDWEGGGGGGGGAGVNGGSGGAGGTITNNNAATTLGNIGFAGSSGSSTSGGAGGYSGGGSGWPQVGGVGGGLGSNGSSGTTSLVGTATPGFPVSQYTFGASPSGGSGGTRGYYQVGSSFINSGSGISGTVAGRSS